MFSDYAAKYKAYLTGFGAFLLGEGSIPSFNTAIDFSYERNLLQNASSAETLISLSNAMYDQVAAARSIKEIYKTPKDYYTDYQNFINSQTSNIDFLATDVQNKVNTTIANINTSKSLKGFSSTLQKKLSLINPTV